MQAWVFPELPHRALFFAGRKRKLGGHSFEWKRSAWQPSPSRLRALGVGGFPGISWQEHWAPVTLHPTPPRGERSWEDDAERWRSESEFAVSVVSVPKSNGLLWEGAACCRMEYNQPSSDPALLEEVAEIQSGVEEHIGRRSAHT
jgi:hypothetical protein